MPALVGNWEHCRCLRSVWHAGYCGRDASANMFYLAEWKGLTSCSLHTTCCCYPAENVKTTELGVAKFRAKLRSTSAARALQAPRISDFPCILRNPSSNLRPYKSTKFRWCAKFRYRPRGFLISHVHRGIPLSNLFIPWQCVLSNPQPEWPWHLRLSTPQGWKKTRSCVHMSCSIETTLPNTARL